MKRKKFIAEDSTAIAIFSLSALVPLVLFVVRRVTSAIEMQIEQEILNLNLNEFTRNSNFVFGGDGRGLA